MKKETGENIAFVEQAEMDEFECQPEFKEEVKKANFKILEKHNSKLFELMTDYKK